MVFQARAISGMIAGWQRGKAYWTPTASPGFVPGLRSRGDSAIRRPGLSSWCGGKKNRVRMLWDHSSEFLRSQGPPDSRSVVRGAAHLPGGGDPPGSVSTVWQSEAGEGALGGGPSVLHEAVCLVCGTTLPRNGGQGGGSGAQARLEDGQGLGEGVYAGSSGARGRRAPRPSALTSSRSKKGIRIGS